MNELHDNCQKGFFFLKYTKGPFALDDNDIIFLSSSENCIIGNHVTHFFFFTPDEKNIDKSASSSSSTNGPSMEQPHSVRLFWTSLTYPSQNEFFSSFHLDSASVGHQGDWTE